MAKYDEIIARIKKILPKNADFDYIEDFKLEGIVSIDLLLFIKFVTPYRRKIKSIVIPISITKWADVKNEGARLNNLKCMVDSTVYSTGEVSSSNAPELAKKLNVPWIYWRFYFDGISLSSVFQTDKYDPSALDYDMQLEDLLHINISKPLDVFPTCDAKIFKQKIINPQNIFGDSEFVKFINQGTSLGNTAEKK